jgi:hypothetical protein
LRNLDSDLQQFPVNAWRSPAGIGETHLTD